MMADIICGCRYCADAGWPCKLKPLPGDHLCRRCKDRNVACYAWEADSAPR